MDFLRKSADQSNVRTNGVPGAAPATHGHVKVTGDGLPKWVRMASVVLLFSLAVLAVALASLFYFSGGKEGKLVDSKRYQAVFLTNGQVYFGKVKEVTTRFMSLEDIYYLNTQTTTDNKQPTSFSLVKLGCELHKPADRMVINQQQVSFWENIQTDGKVAKGIDQWKSENPNGQKCTESSNSTQQSTTNNQQQQQTNTNTNTNNQQQTTNKP